jgi:methylthioribose-1-phosphate isomerase
MTHFTSMALKVDRNGVWVLDQTQLPGKEVWLASPSAETMMGLIRELKVRGAPLIGVAAATQVGMMAARSSASADNAALEKAIMGLREARPTAVNLMHAMDRLLIALRDSGPSAVVQEAEKIRLEDVELCEKMAKLGAAMIKDGDRVLTHCNTGGLATAGVGTALGAIVEAYRQGKKLHVLVDETRPLLQGGRLTTWELDKHKIPYTLICDNMAASLMQQGRVDCVFVGADRIAENGDFANKVGTYGLAVSCRFHSVPFYVVAPHTSVDASCPNGSEIPVEKRSADEVRGVKGSFGQVILSLENAPVWNPAFDVTPESLVTAWILDRGVYTREDVKAGALVRHLAKQEG